MVTDFSILDYSVLGVFLAALVGLGAWAARGLSSSDEFLLAGRSLIWWPLAVSLAVAGLAALFYCSAPSEAYYVGMKLLLVPLLIWASAPIVFWCIIPLYYELDLDSVYEYLELRYDPTTRAVAGGTYVCWQLLWLGAILALPCKALHIGTGLDISTLLLLVGVGTVVTVYTFLGGIKAAVWTGVAQLGVMIVALVVLVLTIAANLDEGLPRIWEVAKDLDRNTIVDFRLAEALSAKWSVWAAVPFMAILPIYFFVADQATLQRFFSARDDRDVKLSYLFGCGLFTLIVAVAMYVGLGLLAVYHDNAQAEVPPNWVVNSAVDPDTGRRLVGPKTVIDAETIVDLAQRGVILDPNTNRKFEDPQELIDARGEIVIDRLATRATRGRGGERRLRTGSDELLSRFVHRHVPHGLAGLVLAAMLAAGMCVIGSGLSALATLVVIDFHRRFGWAERWLAAQCGKQPDDLDQVDEMRLARPTVLALGGAVIVISLAVVEFGHVVGFLLGVLGVFAGPLLGIFLLGLFTRRTTGTAAVIAMVLGTLTALWAAVGNSVMPAPLWPFEKPLGAFWPMLFGLATTLVTGYLLSFAIGEQKSRNALSGLVVGIGRPGVLLETEDEMEEEAEVFWIETEQDSPPESPWS